MTQTARIRSRMTQNPRGPRQKLRDASRRGPGIGHCRRCCAAKLRVHSRSFAAQSKLSDQAGSIGGKKTPTLCWKASRTFSMPLCPITDARSHRAESCRCHPMSSAVLLWYRAGRAHRRKRCARRCLQRRALRRPSSSSSLHCAPHPLSATRWFPAPLPSLYGGTLVTVRIWSNFRLSAGGKARSARASSRYTRAFLFVHRSHILHMYFPYPQTSYYLAASEVWPLTYLICILDKVVPNEDHWRSLNLTISAACSKLRCYSTFAISLRFGTSPSEFRAGRGACSEPKR